MPIYTTITPNLHLIYTCILFRTILNKVVKSINSICLLLCFYLD